uniref:Septin 5 n=1 Tax=Sarcophilus harrisii TaxID=9305 RepID=A0A7N4PX71_SARHA
MREGRDKPEVPSWRLRGWGRAEADHRRVSQSSCRKMRVWGVLGGAGAGPVSGSCWELVPRLGIGTNLPPPAPPEVEGAVPRGSGPSLPGALPTEAGRPLCWTCRRGRCGSDTGWTRGHVWSGLAAPRASVALPPLTARCRPRLRPVDVEFMKALHEKVNIVPLIAKADCLVPGEIRKLKERIREEIDKFGIKVYQFPECDSDEDEEFKQQDRELKESAPFAVIGSNTVVEAKGQRVRGRLYPWGIVEVENQAHCDFVKLRNMLIRTHMHDLKDVTCDVHYENYRAHCIQQMTSKLTQDSRIESPIPILPVPTPDTETEKLIKMKDEELRRMQEMLQKMKQQMQDQ